MSRPIDESTDHQSVGRRVDRSFESIDRVDRSISRPISRSIDEPIDRVDRLVDRPSRSTESIGRSIGRSLKPTRRARARSSSKHKHNAAQHKDSGWFNIARSALAGLLFKNQGQSNSMIRSFDPTPLPFGPFEPAGGERGQSRLRFVGVGACVRARPRNNERKRGAPHPHHQN